MTPSRPSTAPGARERTATRPSPTPASPRHPRRRPARRDEAVGTHARLPAPRTRPRRPRARRRAVARRAQEASESCAPSAATAHPVGRGARWSRGRGAAARLGRRTVLGELDVDGADPASRDRRPGREAELPDRDDRARRHRRLPQARRSDLQPRWRPLGSAREAGDRLPGQTIWSGGDGSTSTDAARRAGLVQPAVRRARPDRHRAHQGSAGQLLRDGRQPHRHAATPDRSGRCRSRRSSERSSPPSRATATRPCTSSRARIPRAAQLSGSTTSSSSASCSWWCPRCWC